MTLNLPGLTINDPVKEARVLAAFNSSPTEYRTWLVQALTNEVIQREVAAIRAEAAEHANSVADEVRQMMDGT